MATCNELHRGSRCALPRKGANLLSVFYRMKGGKLMNISNSTTLQSEKLIDVRQLQWNDIDWRKVVQNVNRLQTRITRDRKLNQ
jgi:RNA-directed DNA polymerase